MSYLEASHQVGDREQWAQHITEPFSEESLGDPHKPYLTIENLRFPDVRTSDEDELVQGTWYKGPDMPSITLSCLSNVCSRKPTDEGLCNQLDYMSILHESFQDAARRIIGKEAYTRATVGVTFWRNRVPAGTGQTTYWHLDTYNDIHYTVTKDKIGLMGLISDVLPTEVLLNPPTRPDDYERGKLRRVLGTPIEEAELCIRTLQPNTLTIVRPLCEIKPRPSANPA
jgi:hypothetical protein